MCTVDKTRPQAAGPAALRSATGRRAGVAASILSAVVVAAAAALAPQTSNAQARGNDNGAVEDDGASALEQLTERVAALERLAASLDTRLSLIQEAARPPERGRPAELRIDELERQVAQLRLDLQRLQSSVDSASRTAENAQRSATQAENMARDALSRASR